MSAQKTKQVCVNRLIDNRQVQQFFQEKLLHSTKNILVLGSAKSVKSVLVTYLFKNINAGFLYATTSVVNKSDCLQQRFFDIDISVNNSFLRIT